MKIHKYLDRIAYTGPVLPLCLTASTVVQAFSIPYESLDIQLGRYLNGDLSRIFEKLVSRRRGVWCYEVHELLFWALQQIGFEARLVTAGIDRREFGDVKMGNHTAILVQLDQLYLADLGLADGIRDPILLLEGEHEQGRLSFRLERVELDYWRFPQSRVRLSPGLRFQRCNGGGISIDQRSHELQTDQIRALAQNLVCQIMHPEAITCLTGRVL